MADEGTIIGSTKSPAASKAGERVLMYYRGGLTQGDQLIVYLSNLTAYWAETHEHSDGSNSPYITSVYEVQGQSNYRRLYVSTYRVHSGVPPATATIDTSVYILGSR